MKYCSNCKAEIEQEEQFCSNCGKPIKTKAPKSESVVNNQTDKTLLKPHPYDKKTNKLKLLRSILIVLMAICLASIAYVVFTKLVFNNSSIERLAGNSVNGGLIAQEGKWLYYNSPFNKGNIYKLHWDKNELVQVNDDDSWNLSVLNDWIYYSNLSDGGKTYKIRTNGEERTKLNDDDSWSINVADGWIYYRNRSDGYKIYKIRINGEDQTKLNDEDSMFLNVANKRVYYRSLEDGRYYSIDINGNDRQQLK